MLGIIGGMGPAASSLFYDMITEETAAASDQENLDLILISRASMPDRTGAILSGDKAKLEAVKRKLLKDALFLSEAGCGAICVTCNTAHYFVDMIENDVPVPFIHMIRETAAELENDFAGKTVAVLATDGTIKTKLYQRELAARGITPYIPTQEAQSLIMSEIYDHIKGGRHADADMWKRIEGEIMSAGAGAAILACTELSVIKNQLTLSDYYYDPMEIMAARAVSLFRERGEI